MDYVACYLLLCLLAHTDGEVPPLAAAFLDARPEAAAEAATALAAAEEWAGPGCYMNRGAAALETLRYFRAVVGDAPRLATLERLPSLESLEASRSQAAAHVRRVEEARDLAPARFRDEYDDWLGDATRLCGLYEDLCTAARPPCYEYWDETAYRRAALGRAARVVGRECLEAGGLPGPLPAHRFRRID